MNKIVCIKDCNSRYYNYIKCYKYEVYEFDVEMSTELVYFINIMDNSKLSIFDRDNFITLSEWRNKQIDEIYED